MATPGWEAASDAEALAPAYEIVGELGRGGSAVVYRAHDRTLGRDVAVKVVRQRGARLEAEQVERLAREARTVARLSHPRIVTVHAVLPIPDGLALVMPLIPGRTLKQCILDDGPMPLTDVRRVLHDVASALAFAHGRGVVHRDVKPENIFLDAEHGGAMLSDFGIAHSIEFDSRLTLTGIAIGTPTYMAPELLDGGHPDPRSDVYGLGLVAWEMLTGQQPWAGETLYGVIYRQKHDALPPVDHYREDVPERLQYIVERALQKRPAARWAGADGLLVQLNGAPLPDDWLAWRAQRERRRALEELAALPVPEAHLPDAPDAGTPLLLATERFDRRMQGHPVAVPLRHAAPASDASESFAGYVAEQDPRPDWAHEHERAVRTRRRRWIPAAAAVVVLLTAMAGTRAWRAGAPSVSVAAHTVRTPRAPNAPGPNGRAAADTVMAPFVVGDTTVLMTDEGVLDDVTIHDAEFDQPLVEDGDESAPRRASPVARSTRRIAAARARLGARPAVREARAPAPAFMPVASGGMHSCALRPAGLFCWGSNEHGQLGASGDGASPTRVRDAPAFTHLTAGQSHSCALTGSGQAYCWGLGTAGQLGTGRVVTSQATPSRVATGMTFVQLRAGSEHTCGVSTGGQVLCWGSNRSGQLGDGTAVGRSTPVLVNSRITVRAVATGEAHTCALTHDGAVFCWGRNTHGQVGGARGPRVEAPHRVTTDTRFTSIAAGGTHSCAVSEQGDVWCWGTWAGVSSDEPVRVGGVRHVRRVVAGSVHACAIDGAGVVWCWGSNPRGQIGDGTTTDHAQAVRVQHAPRYATLDATGAHTCGTTTAGAVFCWGVNTRGQLGDGGTSYATRPVPVFDTN